MNLKRSLDSVQASFLQSVENKHPEMFMDQNRFYVKFQNKRG